MIEAQTAWGVVVTDFALVCDAVSDKLRWH